MAIDLQKISGLPIFFDKKRIDLNFNGDFPYIKKSERTLEELKLYLKNSDVKNWSNPIYRVWRNAHLASDNEKITSHNLRYDLTLLPSGIIGDEFVKTAGHYHKNPYPEIYEVLLGRAYFLIQSESIVYLAEAGPGEKFIIPPSFGHNTINVFNEPLLMTNLVSEKAEYDYEPYKNNHGAMYYFLKNNDLIDIVKNPNYESVPEIKKIRVREYPEFGLVKNRPLYSLVNNLEKLKFLNYSEEFSTLGW
ncbi:hypothetical protein A2819_02640 [Candidatus Azambacteria bacterium RIFCSPHIGHO2_01_FULL_40_24]|uniref:glucose-6-phosphate isomerase n=1 Tax=Candidatus Azambacteria bacterium RIFCSPHIGHO2_01_FULL_40_24 TaxID=1797301 RepID=A0A1F5B4R9_9BACT|nr:MAG: hypothetical protein A2819_02640 [Candidatus Azambacteria bacterium RIFCSPHIGHO2_01_FULL_40_24]